LKIAYICSDVDVQLYGHEGCSVHVREFTNALVENGHDVFILCAWTGQSPVATKARVHQLEPVGQNSAMWEYLKSDPVVQNHQLDRDLGSVLWNTWLQIDGAAIFEKERPDFIYERYALFGSGGIELSRRFEIPIIHELNAPLCDQQRGYHRFTLEHTACRMEAEILANSHSVVALTRWLEDWAADIGVDRSKIHVLPDAVSDSLFKRTVSGNAVRHRLGWKCKSIIGFVGSFHSWHDVSGLIDAFAQLYREDANRRLLLIGNGEKRASLEKKVRKIGIAEAVCFQGRIPHELVPEHLAAMDIAVVPYRPIDNFFFSPMKLFESMAMGTPTVAADLGQISELIEHGVTGWLYPAGDNERLAEGIRKLLDDTDMAAQIGRAAREYVLTNHTWSTVVSKVVAIARELISAHSSSTKDYCDDHTHPLV
jgi:glycosyltransferase involved in cell wall biosynthesis